MQFISIMEIIGTIAFAVTGALVAIEKDLDYYGICFLAVITAVGGGILRDIVINRDLPLALEDPVYVAVSLVTAFLVIIFYKKLLYMDRIITLCDAIGLAAFTAIGSIAATNNGYDSIFVILALAMLTGTGGGAIRDICAGRIPFVFEKEIYAVASLIGGALYAISIKYTSMEISMYISFAITFIVRMVSVKMDIHLGKVKK